MLKTHRWTGTGGYLVITGVVLTLADFLSRLRPATRLCWGLVIEREYSVSGEEVWLDACRGFEPTEALLRRLKALESCVGATVAADLRYCGACPSPCSQQQSRRTQSTTGFDWPAVTHAASVGLMGRSRNRVQLFADRW
jgi:hypothetical protein